MTGGQAGASLAAPVPPPHLCNAPALTLSHRVGAGASAARACSTDFTPPTDESESAPGRHRLARAASQRLGHQPARPMPVRARSMRWSSGSQGSASSARGWSRSTFQGRVTRITGEM